MGNLEEELKKLPINVTCPNCNAEFDWRFPALSRRDNKTEICPDCGTREALEDFTRGNNR